MEQYITKLIKVNVCGCSCATPASYGLLEAPDSQKAMKLTYIHAYTHTDTHRSILLTTKMLIWLQCMLWF